MKHEDFAEGCTDLGKFDEVYVKISDVQAALSVEDRDGCSTLLDNGAVWQEALDKQAISLRKLNIIKD